MYGFVDADECDRMISVYLEDIIAFSASIDDRLKRPATTLYLSSGATLRVTDSMAHVMKALKSYDLVAPFE